MVSKIDWGGFMDDREPGHAVKNPMYDDANKDASVSIEEALILSVSRTSQDRLPDSIARLQCTRRFLNRLHLPQKRGC